IRLLNGPGPAQLLHRVQVHANVPSVQTNEPRAPAHAWLTAPPLAGHATVHDLKNYVKSSDRLHPWLHERKSQSGPLKVLTISARKLHIVRNQNANDQYWPDIG